MELKTIVFTEKEEADLKKLLTKFVGELLEKYFNDRITDIQEYHAQIDRHKEEVKKELDDYTSFCLDRIRKEKQ